MLPVLVLTAGLGTRLRPLTDLLAKPALPVAGQPLIARILRWLASEGVDDAVLNLSHLPETVASVVGDGSQFGMRVRYSWEQPVLGSAGGPRHALPLLGSRFLIVNGDTLTNVVLGDVIDTHTRSGAAVTMALVPHPAPGRYGGVHVNDAGLVDRFTARNAKGAERGTGAPRATEPGGVQGTPPENNDATDGPLWHYIGVQVVEASVFADLPDNEPAESVGGIYRPLVKQGLVAGYRSDAVFRDIGKPGDYLDTAFAVAHDEGRLGSVIEEDGAEYDASARLDRVILWPGSRVAAGASLTNCIVAGAHVPAGMRAEHAVLMPGPSGTEIVPFP
ncbi:MAG TPA: NDP-sugar synthase [Vicinamibacterales bacterium]|nr:NDP-sugar synthase [Vicinamibacterales bacterium]